MSQLAEPSIAAKLRGTVVHRKLDDAYALWFANSRSFLMLKEPAWEVFRLYREGASVWRIREACEERFGSPENDIPRFVDEIISFIRFCNNRRNRVIVSRRGEIRTIPRCNGFHSAISYRMGSVTVLVRYQTEELEFMIHPTIGHLVSETAAVPEHVLECCSENGLAFLKYNRQLVDAFGLDDAEFFKGAVSQQMYSLIYGREFNRWMMMLHASGVLVDGQAVLFSAAAGSGKSTLAALLRSKGFGFLSDDFIGADEQGRVYPFPGAISVKDGALEVLSEVYPELRSVPREKAYTGKMVSYLPVDHPGAESKNGYPVKAFVFVSYSSSEPYQFEEVEHQEGLQILLKETWVNPRTPMVTAFFDWVVQTRFFRLQYGHLSQALEAIDQIRKL